MILLVGQVSPSLIHDPSHGFEDVNPNNTLFGYSGDDQKYCTFLYSTDVKLHIYFEMEVLPET